MSDDDMGSGSGGDSMGDDVNSEEGGSNEDEEEDKAIDLENQFYAATDEMEENKFKDALASFRKCVKMEKEFLASKDVTEGKWAFKSLTEIVMLCLKLNKPNDEIIKSYKEMLTYKGDDVNDNLLTRAISRVLDHAASLNNQDLEAALYEATGNQAGGGGGSNKRIWFKTNMKKAQGFLTHKKYAELKECIKELEKYVKDEGAQSDQLLDVYSLEIQMFMDQGDKMAVKKTYEKAVHIVKSNPGTLSSKMPLFQFCGGKIMMEDGDFDNAYATLFDAFQYFQNVGSDTRVPCLKYMLIANMLKEAKKGEAEPAEDGSAGPAEKQAKINPFDSKDVANMRNHASIEPVAQLLDAYEKNNIRNFERILRANPKEITEDSFLNQFIGRLLTKVRIAKILEMVQPYTRINTQFLATQLTIDREEVEDLLVRLVLDNEIEARIDGVKHVLYLESHAQSAARYRALERWSVQLGGVNRAATGTVFN